MSHRWWTPKGFVLATAAASAVCAAVIVAIGLAYPEPVSSAALGPEWECSRQALVWTTCTRVKRAQSAFIHVAEELVIRFPQS